MQGSQQGLTGPCVRIWLNHSFEIVLLANSSIDGQAHSEENDLLIRKSPKRFFKGDWEVIESNTF